MKHLIVQELNYEIYRTREKELMDMIEQKLSEIPYIDKRNRQIMMRSDIKLPQPFASWSNSL